MTRDEAVKIVTVCNPTPYPQAFVQALEALKLLKLDEPKSVESRLRDVLDGFGLGCYHASEFQNSLRVHGLKITEK